ncbi:MAG TPA: UDP-N-acetylmuramate dehydrogenase [Baekduia sp.]|uniref:UDP-N-acetylmuramate dehydrogenase n=1 Tax=Baekduia sp. TaxID=2600305 RepID=UPI002BC89A2B|nr:UDP-N-acetylmuramate dehydrogenase [Baekduia sp.]HMJ35544.1 UDP-N-acetylmuramate dehydrogenase [Baekduia sp.]
MDLSGYTTLRLGGPATELVEATDEAALLAVVCERTSAGEPLLLLAGGSNLVVADEGFDGTVVHVATRGIAREGDVLHVAAGEPWDAFVARCVADGLAGIECLAGIPGSVGATPIQNVGAYGQDVSETIVSVRALDRSTGVVGDLAPEDCGFAYRSSAFKREPGRWVVLRVSFALAPGERSRPIRYAELARTLGVEVGETAPLRAVHEAVLGLRRGKGMVLDAADADTASAGSFFTNPILTRPEFAALEARVAERLGPAARPPAFPEPGGRTKSSAAWLIERAGFARGHGDPAGIAISTKHVLALTNRGHGTTAGLVALAHEIADGVQAAFGVALVPEPVFVGHSWFAGAQPRA